MLTFEKIDASALEILRSIAIKTFDETFSPHNTPQVMNDYMRQAFAKDQLENELNNDQNHFYLA